MRIEELHLQNFRGFRDLKLTLPPDLAVFIGVNGSGKSSILDSIAIFLSQFLSEISEFLISGFDLTEDDININSNITHNSLSISTDEDVKLVWESFIDRYKKHRLKSYIFKQPINSYAVQIVENITVLPESSLPILVYYQTNRILINSALLQDVSEDAQEQNQFDAYKKAFSHTINDFRYFLYWFKEEEEYENEVRLREDTNFRNPRLQIIRKVLETFLENFPNAEFSDLHIVRANSQREGGIRRLSKPSLVIKKNGKNFKLDQLSDGEKTLLMIVVDIARRLAILNPSITNPSELLEKGTGIILIDEIDLHLHPQWQRIVIPSFRKTFPNCQFIVTTHSPQVLSGVNRENVFILEDSEIVETPHTFGRDSNSILSEVMGVEKRPVKMQERIDKCFEMIDNDNLEEAKLELQKLSESLGNNDPDMIQAYTLIDFLNRVE
ncbi:MAG: AAA family ATPase [Dolichospermum sp. DEX189]|jgi:predicted ATP-binding protein involved in virulence|uniref:AAA family ATPase n=1 Tax=Aphanizomenon flos-aquae FACHB-1040 TaxID=2692887 RepID=A0ABR8C1G6_APHFL|nr:AAA family ATPase [Aphanizomenon flos-aquae]MBD2280605.1 AAA family ATPase [Aphanizomenon flos-aquae FACHB-1040]MBO1070385.1 AAA family ATPase [Dolichospermum sp. DEX189]